MPAPILKIDIVYTNYNTYIIHNYIHNYIITITYSPVFLLNSIVVPLVTWSWPNSDIYTDPPVVVNALLFLNTMLPNILIRDPTIYNT